MPTHSQRALETPPPALPNQLEALKPLPEHAFSTPPPHESTDWHDPNLPIPLDAITPKPNHAVDLSQGEPITGHGPTIDAATTTAPSQPDHKPSNPLRRKDVKADPILFDLATQQGHSFFSPTRWMVPLAGKNMPVSETVRPTFKAMPAPNMQNAQVKGEDGKVRPVGPRLSKAAALRMGVWEPKQRVKTEVQEDKAKKPRPSSMAIPSLSAPVIPPKPTRSTQPRTAQTASAGPPPARRLKTADEVAAEKQARLAEEKAERRKSVVLPASYSTPSIMPRMNRSAALRTGTATGPPVTGSRVPPVRSSNAMPPTNIPSTAAKRHSTLGTSTAHNITGAKDSETGEKGTAESGAKIKRSSTVTGVRSLGAPSIMPRLNKSAMLRSARPSTAAGGNTTTAPPPSAGPRASTSLQRIQSASGTSITTGKAPSAARPTKASLLRAAAALKAKGN